MSPSTLVTLFLLLAAVWSFIHLRSKTRRRNGRHRPPPGPFSLPIIGYLPMLGHLPHRTLQRLAKKYGPIMSVQLGSVLTIVVSSPRAAELFLKTHDAVFASRPKVQASEFLSYGSKGIAFGEYGPYWRNVRKFCTMELLSVSKIDTFAGLRRAELWRLVEEVREEAAARSGVVDVSEKVGGLIEDMTCTMVFGRKSVEGFDLKAVVRDTLEFVGAFNVADFVPCLGPFDLQGLTRRLKSTTKTLDKILEIIIEEREQQNSNEITHQRNNHGDFIDVLLSLKNNSSSSTHDELSHSINRSNIKAIILDMIVGALDTSATAIEWILSELLSHPRVLKKLQSEIQVIVGENRVVDERDLEKFEYLEMVIKESLRLHPVAPLLVPRESKEEIEIDGYFIPKKSRILVNYGAIGRDPDVWSENAEEFVPERFGSGGGGNVDLRGQHFELIPFGSGRRGCPGMHLGLTNIRVVVAQLVHCFDWELPDGMAPEDLDTSDKFGLSCPRAKHLQAIPTYRLHNL